MDDLTENGEQMEERLHQLISELPHALEITKTKITQQQMKQKEYHDNHVRHETSFKIGDKVLLYRAEKEKQWTGKLEEKWKGPYYIHMVLQNGSYKLRSYSGQVLKTPFNGKLLKIYQDRTEWTPIITI